MKNGPSVQRESFRARMGLASRWNAVVTAKLTAQNPATNSTVVSAHNVTYQQQLELKA